MTLAAIFTRACVTVEIVPGSLIRTHLTTAILGREEVSERVQDVLLAVLLLNLRGVGGRLSSDHLRDNIFLRKSIFEVATIKFPSIFLDVLSADH